MFCPRCISGLHSLVGVGSVITESLKSLWTVLGSAATSSCD